MSVEAHHRGALVETAQAELDRAHRAAMTLEAGEVRRGLSLALTALRDASALQPPDPVLGELAATVQKALADLDSGALAEMAALIEDVRKRLEGGATPA